MSRSKKKPLNWLDKTFSVLILLVIVEMIVALSVADGAKLYVLLGGSGLLVPNLLFVLYFARRSRLQTGQDRMLWKLFITFVRIGGFTFRGDYVILSLMQHDVMEKNHWVTGEEFINLSAVSQSLSGVSVVNMSIFIGHRLKGYLGAVTCAIGTTLPSSIIILLLAMLYQEVNDSVWVQRATCGTRPVVVTMIAIPAITTWRAMKGTWRMVWTPILFALLIWLVGVSPVWTILGSALGGITYNVTRRKQDGRAVIYLQLFWVHTQIGLFGFGGGYAMLSLIQNEVVYKYHWLTNQQFTDIVVVSQVIPGPIGISSATYIGYSATGGNILGSLLVTTAVMLLPFFLCLIISRSFQAFRSNRYVDAALLGIRPASVGFITAAALILMIQPGLWTLLTFPAGTSVMVDNIIVTENFIDYRSFLIFAVTGLVLYKKWIHPILLIVLAGITGVLLYSL